MYKDTTNFDHDKYSLALFGRSAGISYYLTETEVKDMKKANRLTYDCFLDIADNQVRSFFGSLVGYAIENQVFAVQPNGKIIPYFAADGDFSIWIEEMYNTAYPNK